MASAAVTPRMDSTRTDTSGIDRSAVETGAVDTMQRDTTPIDSAQGYDSGVVHPGRTGSDTAGGAGGRATAAVTFLDRDGRQVGTGTITQTDKGVPITAALSGLPAGEHAFHVHQTGKFAQAGGFRFAGQTCEHGPQQARRTFCTFRMPSEPEQVVGHAAGQVGAAASQLGGQNQEIPR